MKFAFKLVLLAGILAILMPFVAPGSPMSGMVRAAFQDVGTFCDRRADACRQGALLLRQAGDLVSRTVTDLRDSTSEQTPPDGPNPHVDPDDQLTKEDRELAPPNTAESRKSAFAGIGSPRAS